MTLLQLQEGIDPSSHAVGGITTIITGAVGDIARTVGGFATDVFEIRTPLRRARRDYIEVVRSEPVDSSPEAAPKHS